MIKSRFSYLKLSALIAVFAMTLAPYLRTSAGSRLPPIVTGADLSNEQRIIAKYADDLAAYDKQTQALGKRARLESSDLDEVQNRSGDLKRRLSEVQNAVREIVRKLKAANEFDNLDTDIVARITEARDKSYFQQNSLKKLLETASNDLTSYGNDITTPVDNLRRKLTSRTASPSGDSLIRAHHAPVPFFRNGLQCMLSNIQVGIVWRMGGAEDPAHQNTRICACQGGSTCAGAAI
jgi:ribosome-binding protein aMBF1 (putative translation factor)